MSPSTLHRSRSRRIGKACFETLEGRRLLSFTSAAPNSVGTNPQAIVTADFNGDGKADLATVNAGSNNVSVLLGNGAGGFGAAQQFAAAPANTFALNPSSLAVADFNGDAKADLAVAFGAYGVYILKGNGDGTLQSPVRFGPSIGLWNAMEIAVGDFNGDHKADIVVTENDDFFSGVGGYIWVLLGNGQGGMMSESMRGEYPRYGLAVADLNRDGKLDVATAGYAMLGNGNGTLGEPCWVSSWSDNPDAFPRAAAVGDLTGDGIPDLVSAGYAVTVGVGLGDGRFTDGPPFSQPADSPFHTAAATGDFNGDGKLDVVTTDSNADVWLGNGDGALREPVPFATGTSPAAVAVGDFNRDGRADVATANGGSNNVSVLLNDGNWATKVFVGPGGGGSGGTWSNASNWSPAGVPEASDYVAIADEKSVSLAGSATVAGLALSGGATLSVGQSGNRVLRTTSLNITGAARLNLNDNDLIIDYPGAGAGGSPMSDVFANLVAGRAATPTSGIYSGTANASGGMHALGVAEASDVLGISGAATDTFSGQTVDASCVLVKFTYAGDANLDGRITGDDYSAIDFNILLPGASGWWNGDFNFDGLVTGDDYSLIDFNLLAQGAPL
jgi:hypothetical protein